MITLIVIVLAISTSVTLTSSATMNYSMALTSAKISSARATAESGVSWAEALMARYTTSPVDDLPPFMDTLYDYLYYETDLSVSLVDDAITVTGGAMTGGGTFTIYIEPTEWMASQDSTVVAEFRVLVSGTYRGVTRWCQVLYDVDNSERILSYGVASSTRLMLRGNVTINSDIYSPWVHGLEDGKFVWKYDDSRGVSRWWHQVAWPLDVGSTISSERAGESININGNIYTSMSRGEFNMDRILPCYRDMGGYLDYMGWTSMSAMDAVRDSTNQSKVQYDEPNVLNLTWKDFKTNDYRPPGSRKILESSDKKKDGSNPLVADRTEQVTWNGRTYDVWVYEDRNEEAEGGNQILENINITTASNAHFKNCIFRGVTYVDSVPAALPSDANHHNNVIFENCTFEGPIVTDVPKYVQLHKDSMEFRGQTSFAFDASTQAEGYSVLAPNFNINFGSVNQADPDEHLTLYGLVLGGIVDIRQSATINGSVVSMGRKDFISTENETLYDEDEYWQHGMNIGNWEDSMEGTDDTVIDRSAATRNITITPQPGNPYPGFGMYKKYSVSPKPHSFLELTELE
ncbi:MAG: hypothetical protein HN909_05365 [Phycisphaerales bacterium]|jgi:hypothetical protein|nr:hypothetical protein [Phycisphaerales bacterium]MBT7171182.1 hypothetical protein [Phycisphaerales bacterium]